MSKTPQTVGKAELYRLQKRIGTRNPKGEWRLQRLKPRHYAIIAMSTDGVSNREIARKLGLSEVTVSRILRDPLIEGTIHQIYFGLEQEMRGIAFSAINAVRTVLRESDDPDLWMKAVDRFERLFKTFTREGKALVGKGNAVDISFNFASQGEDRKADAIDKLVGLLEAAAPEAPVIDVTPDAPPED